MDFNHSSFLAANFVFQLNNDAAMSSTYPLGGSLSSILDSENCASKLGFVNYVSHPDMVSSRIFVINFVYFPSNSISTWNIIHQRNERSSTLGMDLKQISFFLLTSYDEDMILLHVTSSVCFFFFSTSVSATKQSHSR